MEDEPGPKGPESEATDNRIREATGGSDIAGWALNDWRPGETFEELTELMDEVNAEGIDTEDGARNAVKLFREAIEYAENFGIRLLAEFEEEEEIANRLTTYRPDEVRTFYQYIATRNADSFCMSSAGITGGYTDNLLSAFRLPAEITGEDVFELLKDNLARIALFYTHYYDIYNAVKHGQRFQVIDITEFSTEVPVELDEEAMYILFVPKSEGEPTSAAVSGRLLANHSFGVAKRIQHLSEAIESENTAEEDGRTIRLVHDDLASILAEYSEVSTDSVVIYGKFERTEEFEVSMHQPAGIRCKDGELQFHLREKGEYGPFTIHFENAPRFLGSVNQTVTLDRFELSQILTIDQYEEVWKFHQTQQEGNIEDIRLYWNEKLVGQGLEYVSVDQWAIPQEAIQSLRTDMINREHIHLLKAMNGMFDERELLPPPHLSDEDLQLLKSKLGDRKPRELSGEEIRDIADEIYES